MAGDNEGVAKEAEATVSEAEINEFLDDVSTVETSTEETPPETTESASDTVEVSEATTEVESPSSAKSPAGEETVSTGSDELPNEVDTLKAQIASLTSLVDKLSAGPAPAQTPTKEPQQDTPVTAKVVGLDEIFKDMDIDKVLDSKENFLEFMTAAMAVVKQQAQVELMANLPQTVGYMIKSHTSVTDTVSKFYTDNPELQGVKQYVSYVAKEVATQNPEWDMQKVLEGAAKKVKEDLQISATSTTSTTESTTAVRKPTLPGGSGGVRNPPKTTSTQQDEINDLIFD